MPRSSRFLPLFFKRYYSIIPYEVVKMVCHKDDVDGLEANFRHRNPKEGGCS